MKVRWERFVRDDYVIGDNTIKNNSSHGIFTLDNGRRFEFSIIDHTRPEMKEYHFKHKIGTEFAYEIKCDILNVDIFKSLGFGCNVTTGYAFLDENPGPCKHGVFNPLTYIYIYRGDKPEHTIEEVEAMIEEAFVKTLTFDHQKEYDELVAKLNKRKATMDEVLAYRENKNQKEHKPSILKTIEFNTGLREHKNQELNKDADNFGSNQVSYDGYEL